MTQSGQGEEPSQRPAREGIVLPSDGGEPLLPGLAGVWAPQPGRPAPAPASAPPGGQAWNQPWGPGGPEGPSPDQDASASWNAHGQPDQQSWPAQDASRTPYQPGPGPLPPEGGHAPSYGTPQTPASGAHQPGAQQDFAPGAYQPGGPEGYGGGPQEYGGGPEGYGGGPEGYGGGPQEYGGGPQGYGGGPQGYGEARESYGPQGGAAPLPPAEDRATHYLPQVTTAPADQAATQFIPPVAASADEGATQYIPPVAPGALPPERSARDTSEDTRALRRPTPPAPQGPGPLPPAAGSDAEATQYIPPVAAAPFGAAPGQDADRQPPAEFDNLFRGSGGDGPAGATQQMPRVDPAQPPPPTAGRRHGGPEGNHGNHGGHDDRGGRTRTGSRLPLLAAVGVGLAVVGIAAGAFLAGGDGEEKDDADRTVSATAPATEGSASAPASADPVREQAVALDELLADSGNSRSAVISAVGDVRSCDNLSEAAGDLRDAAEQRTDLVTRLGQLSVDKLPRHEELTTALTKAWQASASADNHYAAWADQAAGKKGCQKGQARSTGQTKAGNGQSETASTEKAKAAELWNQIAKTYGLTQRQPVQL
ncbi:hypothetical protein [Streptomyces ziwulingensis]|uniref:Uncharacterized protein n=1 Tax=Streptomyces ziwulingensis TaxID=1045501 RepID=A0ABP9CCW3_9ACTN